MTIKAPNIRLWINRFHRWVGLAIGVQVLFWMVSGFYFTLYPIEQIRGEHLRKPVAESLTIESDDLVLIDYVRDGAQSVTLKPFLYGPVYEVERADGRVIYDAASGDLLSPVSEFLARDMALARWAGDGDLVSIERLEKPPRESGASGPVWRADFEGKNTASFYILEDTGQLRSVRTPNWRFFDLMWGLHIMDWTGRETFTSWWMKLFAFLGLVFTVSGFAILIDQARQGRLFK